MIREGIIWKMRFEQRLEGREGVALWRKSIPQKELEQKPEGFQKCTWYNINSKETRMTGAEGPKGLFREVKGEWVGEKADHYKDSRPW